MYNPYNKGRWYRLFLESDGSKVTVTDSDLEVTLSGSNIKFPANFHIVDRKYDINCVEHDAVSNMIIDLIGYADGSQGIAGPVAKAFDYAYIYVFGYFNA